MSKPESPLNFLRALANFALICGMLYGLWWLWARWVEWPELSWGPWVWQAPAAFVASCGLCWLYDVLRRGLGVRTEEEEEAERKKRRKEWQ